ncbi:MAG: hypothetical protein IJ736_05305 [Firmicutes bacterium]|nr:hypothetical protein [Bacillota bacterium]
MKKSYEVPQMNIVHFQSERIMELSTIDAQALDLNGIDVVDGTNINWN